MDDSELLKMSGASAGTIAIVLLVYKIFKSFLGKRLVSTCCGNKMDIGIEVRDASTPVVNNPLVLRKLSDTKNINIVVDKDGTRTT